MSEDGAITGVLVGIRDDFRALLAKLGDLTVAVEKNTTALREVSVKLNVVDRNTTATRGQIDEVHGAVMYPNFAKRPRKRTKKR